LQDFSLLIIEDEILKTYWGKGENGYGGTWNWWVIAVVSSLALLSMLGALAYVILTAGMERARGTWKRGRIGKLAGGWTSASSSSWTGAERAVEDEKDDKASAILILPDKIHLWVSLVFVEIPFLSWRMYTSLRFDIPPSSLILKNIFSIIMEGYALWSGKNPVISLIKDAGMVDMAQESDHN
jgi:hypothetical protein